MPARLATQQAVSSGPRRPPLVRDVNDEPAALSAYGASLDNVRCQQVTDESGRLIVGTGMMVAIWRLTSRERWLALLFGNPVMLEITRFGQDRFPDLSFA